MFLIKTFYILTQLGDRGQPFWSVAAQHQHMLMRGGCVGHQATPIKHKQMELKVVASCSYLRYSQISMLTWKLTPPIQTNPLA